MRTVDEILMMLQALDTVLRQDLTDAGRKAIILAVFKAMFSKK